MMETMNTVLLCSVQYFQLYTLTHPSMVFKTSESMLLAKRTDPSFPSKGIKRVLLDPGIGHLATTTIDPSTERRFSISFSFALILVVLLLFPRSSHWSFVIVIVYVVHVDGVHLLILFFFRFVVNFVITTHHSLFGKGY